MSKPTAMREVEQPHDYRDLLRQARPYVEQCRSAFPSDRRWLESPPANLLGEIDAALAWDPPPVDDWPADKVEDGNDG